MGKHTEEILRHGEIKIAITRDDFMAYEEVRVSGVTNMWHVQRVSQLSGLPKSKILTIMKGYSDLKQAFKV